MMNYAPCKARVLWNNMNPRICDMSKAVLLITENTGSSLSSNDNKNTDCYIWISFPGQKLIVMSKINPFFITAFIVLEFPAF